MTETKTIKVVHRAAAPMLDTGQHCLTCKVQLVGEKKQPWNVEEEDPEFWPYGTRVLRTSDDAADTTILQFPPQWECNYRINGDHR